MSSPIASILVPVYNAERFLGTLVDSVRAQSYTNWELILVDDQSSDGSKHIMERLASEDRRVVCKYNNRNLGPSATLNRAANAATGALLFRLDADDTMAPKRLELQINYLGQHPSVGLLGSFYVNVDQYGRKGSLVSTPIIGGEALKAKFLFSNAMGHSTVVYQADVFRRIGGYDETLRASLDYDLLGRMSRITECAILPKVLIYYATHGSNITTVKAGLQLANAAHVQRMLLAEYGFVGTEDQLKQHVEMTLAMPLNHSRNEYIEFLLASRNWLRELGRQNASKKIFHPAAFDRVTAEVHTRLYARAASPLGLRDYLRAMTTDFRSAYPRNMIQQLGHTLKNGL